jgi:hypothetical protein
MLIMVIQALDMRKKGCYETAMATYYLIFSSLALLSLVRDIGVGAPLQTNVWLQLDVTVASASPFANDSLMSS